MKATAFAAVLLVAIGTLRIVATYKVFNHVIDEPDLMVPHPRMHERAFVVVPLEELGAEATLADGKRLEPVTDAAQAIRRFAPPLDLQED